MVHAVIARLAPGVAVVDVTHEVPAHDIRAGALALWRSAPWLAPGVVLAVVDPGVGTSRRAVAVEVTPPAGGRSPGSPPDAPTVLVGPDNGLLLPAALRLGSITAAVALPPADPAPAGATFAGRDVFAPAAARAATGVELADLGSPVDPATLSGGPVPEARFEPGSTELWAEVLWVDRFGNAQLNVAAAAAPPIASLAVGPSGRPRPVEVVTSYGAIPAGGIALVVDSYGYLAICSARSSAAAALELREGQRVRLVCSA